MKVSRKFDTMNMIHNNHCTHMNHTMNMNWVKEVANMKVHFEAMRSVFAMIS